MLGIDGELTKKLQSKNIRTIVLNNLPREISLIKDFFGFLKLLKIFRQEKPDIIHLNSSKMGFLGAFRRSELVEIKMDHIQWKPEGIEILIPKSKTLCTCETKGAKSSTFCPKRVCGLCEIISTEERAALKTSAAALTRWFFTSPH